MGRALERGDQRAFDQSLQQSREKLRPLGTWLKSYSIRATGNAHIDLAWLWPWTETVEVVRNTFTSVLQLMREYPEFTFTHASAQTYAWMEEKYPPLFEQIKQRVREGRWEPIGGMWVEPDLNLPDGEALVRQILVGKRYFREKFGVEEQLFAATVVFLGFRLGGVHTTVVFEVEFVFPDGDVQGRDFLCQPVEEILRGAQEEPRVEGSGRPPAARRLQHAARRSATMIPHAVEVHHLR